MLKALWDEMIEWDESTGWCLVQRNNMHLEDFTSPICKYLWMMTFNTMYIDMLGWYSDVWVNIERIGESSDHQAGKVNRMFLPHKSDCSSFHPFFFEWTQVFGCEAPCEFVSPNLLNKICIPSDVSIRWAGQWRRSSQHRHSPCQFPLEVSKLKCLKQTSMQATGHILCWTAWKRDISPPESFMCEGTIPKVAPKCVKTAI